MVLIYDRFLRWYFKLHIFDKITLKKLRILNINIKECLLKTFKDCKTYYKLKFITYIIGEIRPSIIVVYTPLRATYVLREEITGNR